MPRFPTNEAEIEALGWQLARGLLKPPLNHPPVPALMLMGLNKNFGTAKRTAIAKAALAQQAVADKDEALAELVEAMKTDLRYAENAVDFDDARLKLIGWSGRKAPTALAPPGQARQLETAKRGPGWIYLDWKAPVGGGRVNAYKVQRRTRDGGPWSDVATAVAAEATLADQPRGTGLEYRVIALNKSGEGQPSNTIMATL